MKRTRLFEAIALTVALMAASLLGCGQASQAGAESQVDQGVASVTEASAEGTDEAEAQDAKVTVQTEAPEVYEARMARAREFVFAWQTTTTYDPDDDTIMYPIDGWYDQALSYIAPDTALYEAFLNSEDPSGPGVIHAAEVVRGAWVISASPYTYTVWTVVSGTQSGEPGWSEQTYETSHTITFDENSQIVRLDHWG